MKAGLRKAVIVGLVSLTVATVPLFASPRGTGDGRSSGNMPPAMGNGEKEPRGMEMGRMKVFGTVSAVSADNGTITVKDADGKERQIHVNPFTQIVEERNNKMNPLTILDVKVGDWVAVAKLDSDTETVEAAHIIVAKN